tara:strand:- start:10774 stop:12219 length:1446 start_codon:yes stop_codon:yes gene_type:complete
MFSKIVVMTAANILVAASGLLRELVLANIYGTSLVADFFLTSYLMVEEFNNILFVGLIFGLFSYIKKIEHSENVLNFLFKLIFYTLPVIFLFVTIFFFGFDGANLFLSKDLYSENFILISKYSSPALSIGLVNSILACYLLYKEKYFIALFSKAINYLALAILLVFNPEPSNGVYLGSIVSLSYLLQFLFLISFFSENELSIKKIFSTQINIFEVTKHASPWLLQPILVPFLANIIGRFLMSDFDSGYISSVSYASKLLNLMNTLTFSIILVGFMDTVSKSNEIDKYKKSISDSLTRIIFSTIPITFICCFYNQEIISILFERGSFDIKSVELTSTAFYIFSLSLFPGVFYGYFSRVIGSMKGNKYLNFLTLLQFFIYLSVMIIFLNDFEGYVVPYGYFICTTILSILIAVFYARDIIPKSSYINFFVCILLCSSLFISDSFFEFLSFTLIVKMICSCFVLLATNGTFILLNKSVKNAFSN